VDANSDEALMLRVRDGQVERLADLYDRYRTQLLNFFGRLTGNPHLSEDLVHEVFLRMLKYRHTFKPDSRFTTWMHQIARNAHCDAWRKRQREPLLDREDMDESETVWSVDPGPDWEARKNQEVALLQEALASLPIELREVLVLTRFQGLKYEEVAKVLDCSLGAVKMRVHRGLHALRDKFSELAGKELS
jgi:RNA polymerase sigma-70 factor (ECF subfamily)